jgi:hypothetical protein
MCKESSMSHPTRPEVSDPNLRAALNRVGSHIENYSENLDRISNDIRAVEQYLTASGIRLTARVLVSRNDERTDRELYDDETYSGGIIRREAHVEWAPGDDGRWRVLHVISQTAGFVSIVEGCLISGPGFYDPEDVESKPLIETPVEVRLPAHKHLGELVEALGTLVEYTPLAKPEPTSDGSST